MLNRRAAQREASTRELASSESAASLVGKILEVRDDNQICDGNDHKKGRVRRAQSASSRCSGYSVMDGILIISQYHRLIDRGMDRIGAVLRAGELQMRPVLMTCVIAGVGLVRYTIDGNRFASSETACGGRGRRHDAHTPSHPHCSSRVDRTCTQHKDTASEVLVAERPVGS